MQNLKSCVCFLVLLHYLCVFCHVICGCDFIYLKSKNPTILISVGFKNGGAIVVSKKAMSGTPKRFKRLNLKNICFRNYLNYLLKQVCVYVYVYVYVFIWGWGEGRERGREHSPSPFWFHWPCVETLTTGSSLAIYFSFPPQAVNFHLSH